VKLEIRDIIAGMCLLLFIIWAVITSYVNDPKHMGSSIIILLFISFLFIGIYGMFAIDAYDQKQILIESIFGHKDHYNFFKNKDIKKLSKLKNKIEDLNYQLRDFKKVISGLELDIKKIDNSDNPDVNKRRSIEASLSQLNKACQETKDLLVSKRDEYSQYVNLLNESYSEYHISIILNQSDNNIIKS